MHLRQFEQCLDRICIQADVAQRRSEDTVIRDSKAVKRNPVRRSHNDNPLHGVRY